MTMRVVVTRPSNRADATLSALLALGHHPVPCPVSQAIGDRGAVALALAKEHAALIITSAEALRAFPERSPDLAAALARPLYAVGKATATAARRIGFTDIRVGSGDGAALAQLVLADRPNGRLLYLAGSPRMPDLEDRLAAGGVMLSVVEAYHMVADATPQAIRAAFLGPPAADAALFHSAEAARAVFAVLGETDHPLACLCMSPRIASAIPAARNRRIRVAKRPDEAALLALLGE